MGTDLNRNFPFHWNQGGGDSYAREIYVGASACSEPECQAVKIIIWMNTKTRTIPILPCILTDKLVALLVGKSAYFQFTEHFLFAKASSHFLELQTGLLPDGSGILDTCAGNSLQLAKTVLLLSVASTMLFSS